MMDNDGDSSARLEAPPLATEATTTKVALGGGLLALAAALVGIPNFSVEVNEALTPARVIASVLAMIVAGSAITLHYRWARFWLLAAGTCVCAGFGFPASWDTFRLVAWVFAGVASLGALLVVLPGGWRMGIVSGLALLHFSGVFVAVTGPSPAPVLTNDLWGRVYRPYLEFAYLNNAYQFYSPDPGPASEIWFCIYYDAHQDDLVKMEVLQRTPEGEPVRDIHNQPVYRPMTNDKGEPTGEPIYDSAGAFIFKEEKDKYGNVLKRPVYRDAFEEMNPDYLRDVRWVKVPKRLFDFRDPLGQTYYRRLSLTEQVVQTTALSQYPPAVQEALLRRRNSMAAIPLDLNDGAPQIQCQIPNQVIIMNVLPSYVRYIAERNRRPDRSIASIRVYRVTHRITPPEEFAGPPDGKSGTDLMDPTTYKPYYQGRFNPQGELLDASDPMLYWLVPIRKNPNARPEDFTRSSRRLSLADYKRLYQDFVIEHSGSNHQEGELDK